MVPCTILGGAFIALGFWPTIPASAPERMLFVCAGLVPIQFGLIAIGFIPWLLSRVRWLRGADTGRAALALLIFQMIAIQAAFMIASPDDEFPMVRPAAFAAIATFGFVGAWLLLSALPETPRRKAMASTAVTVMLATFGLTGALVAGNGELIFVPGAVLLLALAAYRWHGRRAH